jgi:uncharacterized membrane protein YhaH (DUF805 family)
MFSGKLSRGAYARGAAIRIGLFVAVTLAYPFVLMTIVKGSHCGNDTCGALSLVISLVAKPAIHLVFILSFIGITMRRVRDIGLPVALAAIVPVLMLGDLTAATAFGAPWSVGFVLGGMAQAPRHLLMALVCIGFLCFARSGDGPDADRGQRWGMAGALAFGIVTTASIFAALNFIREIGAWLGGAYATKFFLYLPYYYSLIGTPLLLVAMFALVLWRQRPARPA